MSYTKLDDHVHAELLALQGLAVSDIAFLKQQQWQICNHALAIDAAIAAMAVLLKPVSLGESLAVGVIALVVMAFGVFLIHDLGKSLAKGRNRLREVRLHFDPVISLPAYAAGGPSTVALLGAEDKLGLECFFYFVLAVALLVTTWVVYRIACGA